MWKESLIKKVVLHLKSNLGCLPFRFILPSIASFWNYSGWPGRPGSNINCVKKKLGFENLKCIFDGGGGPNGPPLRLYVVKPLMFMMIICFIAYLTYDTFIILFFCPTSPASPALMWWVSGWAMTDWRTCLLFYRLLKAPKNMREALYVYLCC